MPIVTVEAVGGRTVEQKRELVKAITRAFVDIYLVKPERVQVIIHELLRENIGRGGELLCDLQ